MSFAEKLKAARARLGLTQAEAARLLDVSFEAVSKWERGLSIPAAITQEGALSRLSLAGRAAGAGGCAEKASSEVKTQALNPWELTRRQGIARRNRTRELASHESSTYQSNAGRVQ